MGNKSRRGLPADSMAAPTNSEGGRESRGSPGKRGREEALNAPGSSNKEEEEREDTITRGRARRRFLSRFRSTLARTFGSRTLSGDRKVGLSDSETHRVEVQASPCKRLVRALKPNCWSANSGSSQTRAVREQQVVSEGQSSEQVDAQVGGSSRLAALLSSPRLFRKKRATAKLTIEPNSTRENLAAILRAEDEREASSLMQLAAHSQHHEAQLPGMGLETNSAGCRSRPVSSEYKLRFLERAEHDEASKKKEDQVGEHYANEDATSLEAEQRKWKQLKFQEQQHDDGMRKVSISSASQATCTRQLESGTLIQQLASERLEQDELSRAAALSCSGDGSSEKKPLKQVEGFMVVESPKFLSAHSSSIEAQRIQVDANKVESTTTNESLLPLIKPLASSCSSLASSVSGSSSSLSRSSSSASGAKSSASSSVLPSGLREPDCQQVSTERTKSSRQHSDQKQLPQERESYVSQPMIQKPVLVRAPSSGVASASNNNFRKMVKRQQSVDSYRMARELKSKQKRERNQRHKHQSNEAIPSHRQQQRDRVDFSGMSSVKDALKESKVVAGSSELVEPAKSEQQEQVATPLLIRVDPYARPGSFGPLNRKDNDVEASPAPRNSTLLSREQPKATPPSSLSLLPASSVSPSVLTGSEQVQPAIVNHPSSLAQHLPSSGFTVKKYSNASTLSSSLAADLSHQTNGSVSLNYTPQNVHSSTESCSLLEQQRTLTTTPTPSPHLVGSSELKTSSSPESKPAKKQQLQHHSDSEHLYDNKCGLGEDMKFLASLPELCDITFLVGETREPVCAVKSVLAARSRVFHKILFGNRLRRPEASAPINDHSERRDSTVSKAALGAKSSSPILSGRSKQRKQSSPANHRDWSVQADASGFSVSPVPSHEEGSGRLASRTSVTSGGRVESGSFSQASAGSQQPLVIGPGQTATPAPREKRSAHKGKGKGSIRGEAGRFGRMFMKRASDPTIKQQQQPSAAANQALANQNYLDKMSSSQMSTTMIIEEFEPDVFRQLIEYIHTGCVLLQARTLLGLLNAADYYGLEQLRRACLRFVSCCITVDTVCSLLSTAERYIQYKCTKSIVQKVLEFVDSHADEIFKLNAFGLLPEHVVRLILARDGLKADEQAKYSGVYTWCEHYCRSYELTDVSNVMQNFLDLIQFHKISRSVLLQEIYPTRIVPDNVILIALAYQANPQYFEPQPMQARRMTLPNPSCLRGSGPSDPEVAAESQLTDQQLALDSSTRKSVELSGNAPSGSDAQVDEQRVGRLKREATSRASKLRKGSIAQVSLSNVMRLSHKLSIKKRHSNVTPLSSSGGPVQPGAQRKLWPSASSNVSSGTGDSKKRKRSSVAKQQSAFPSTGMKADPVQLGQQILDAYLEQRQREELEEQKRQAAEAAASETALGQSIVPDSGREKMDKLQQKGSLSSTEQAQRKVLVKSASSRKSFKDFKSISRRIFMRHSSNKLQQAGSDHHQQQQADSSTTSTFQDKRRNLFKIKRSETVFETTTGCSP